MSHALQVRVRDSLLPAVLGGIVDDAIASWRFGSQNAVPFTLDLLSIRQTTSHPCGTRGH